MSLKKLFLTILLMCVFVTASFATAKWTWMLYLLEDGTGLSGVDDINEWEANGSTSDVNYLVLFDAQNDSQDGVYYITHDPNGYDSTIRSNIVYTGFGTDPDMSDWHTLKDFMIWVKNNYPAEHYGLTLWDHGSGIFKGEVNKGIFGSIMDDTNQTDKDFVDGMKLWELDDALTNFKNAIGRNLDIIGFDVCLLGHIETAYQLKDCVDYVIASEKTEPGDGWDYVDAFAPLNSNPYISAEQQAKNIVNAYVTFYGGKNGQTSGVTQAATSTALLQSELIPALNTFADKLRRDVYLHETKIKNARDGASYWDSDQYGAFYLDQRDLGSFAYNIVHDTTLPSDLRTAAQDVLDKLAIAVVEEGHTVGDRAYGLKIWMPQNIANDSNAPYYTNPNYYLTFSQTLWDEFLYNYNNPQPYNNDFPPVENLTATSGDGYVTLNWNAPDTRNTLDHYLIKRNGSTIANSVSYTHYTDNNVSNGTTYTYEVYAVYTGSPSGTSSAVSVTATPMAPLTAPYSQDFSSGSLPTGWTNKDNQGSGEVWEFNNPGSRTFNSTSHSNGFAVLDSDHYGSGHSQNADLITPRFDFSSANSITVQFEHYFKYYSNSSATFSYSVNGGSSWTTVQSWNADTDNAATFTHTFASELAGHDNVLFKWNYTGTYGWYWCVDDFSVSAQTVSEPSFALSPTSLSFGSVEVGNSSTKQFTITNSGNATLTGTITTISGYTVSEVTRGYTQGRNSLSYSISANSSKTFNLVFSPSSAGSYNGNISITSNDNDHSNNNLGVTGTGIENPDIAVNPTSFNETVEIDNSEIKSLVIANDGGGTLSYSATVSYSSGNRDVLLNEDFATFPPSGWTTEGGSNWMGKTTNKAGGSSPEAVFYWNPNTTATQRLISKTVNTTGMTSLTLTFKHFIDHYSGTYTLKVETSSNGTNWNTIATYPAANMAANTETITITNSDVGSSTFRIAFTFEGTSYNIDSWNIDDVNLQGTQSTAENWMTLNNNTSVNGSISAGNSDNINVGFNASGLSEGVYHANISINSNDPDESSITIPVTMTVAQAAAPQIAVNPTSLSFGDVIIGQSGTKQFTISNSGNATLTGTITTPYGYSVALAGSRGNNKPEFRNNLSFSIIAGSSKIYNLVFEPTAQSVYNGNVVISNNAQSDVNIAVTGNGVPAPEADISVNPSSITKNVSLGQTGTENLVISNEGNATLNYSASINYSSRERTVLLDEHFDTFPPSGWAISGGNNWRAYNGNKAGGTAPEAQFYWNPDVTAAQRLISKTIDTSGMTVLSLTFKHFIDHYSGTYELKVQTSADGTDWNTVATYSPQNTPASIENVTINNSDVGSSSFRIAFVFDGRSYNINSWDIDDVFLEGSSQNMASWLTLNNGASVSGSISQGHNETITVGFNTTGLSEGTYNATIVVTSNDPDEATVNIPVTMNVQDNSTPSISVSPTSLAFGNVTVGNSSSKTFTISNNGGATLTGTITTPTGYTVSENTRAKNGYRNSLSFSISAGSNKTYNLLFQPTSQTTYNGNIVIENNAGSNVNILVSGNGVAPQEPDIAINPTSINKSAQEGSSTSQILTISNEGTQQLTYTASVNYSTRATTVLIDEDFSGSFPPSGWNMTGGSNWKSYNGNKAGGTAPEAEFYWSPDVTATQKLISKIVDTSGMDNLSLTFKHYIDHYSGDYTLKVETSSNGTTWHTIATYPNQNMTATSETININNDDLGSSTFRIAFTFEGRSYNIDSWNIDNVVLTGSSNSGQNWLTINSSTSVTGSVEAGNNDDLTVTLNAATLSAGTYNASVIITSNDPDESNLTVPVEFTVTSSATPDISVNPTSLSFGDVVVGQSSTKQFTISNSGNATLTGTIATPTDFSVSIAARGIKPENRNNLSFSINSGSSKTFNLVFAPQSQNSYNSNVIIYNNATSNVNLAVSGNGVATLEPEIAVNPTSVSNDMQPNSTDTKTLTITNSGSGSLTYTASVSYSTRNKSTILSANFESGYLPSGWTRTTNSSVGWFITSDGSSQYFSIPSHTKYACSNDDAANDDGSEDYLISSTIDLTGYINATLTFDSFYNGSYSQKAYVEVDKGNGWTVVKELEASSAWTEVQVDLSAYCGESNVKIAFHADDAGAWASGWAVDNVVVTAEQGSSNSWLLLNNATSVNGTIQINSSDDIAVNFNSNGLTDGVYHANIVISSNDSDESTITVPVTLTVGSVRAPSNIVLQIKENTIQLSWDPVRGADAYKILYSEDPAAGFRTLYITRDTKYMDRVRSDRGFYKVVTIKN